MKQLEKDELFQNLGKFLGARGVELKDGSYACALQKTCAFLTDAINMGQEGFERARVEVEKGLDRVRQVVHDQTAPRQPGAAKPASTPPTGGATSARAPKAARPPRKATRPKTKSQPAAGKTAKAAGKAGRSKPR